MDAFVCSLLHKVVEMRDSNSQGRLQGPDRWVGHVPGDIAPDEDLTMEQILENISSTPIGQVLKRIASLPEIRRQKVLRVRRQLSEGKYDLSERLDIALDRVLEDLTT